MIDGLSEVLNRLHDLGHTSGMEIFSLPPLDEIRWPTPVRLTGLDLPLAVYAQALVSLNSGLSGVPAGTRIHDGCARCQASVVAGSRNLKTRRAFSVRIL